MRPVADRPIPRLIHQTWKDHRLPDRFRRSADSWRAYHPGWVYRLWTDADIAAFVRGTYPHLWPLFQGYAHGIQRVDAVRYLILYHFGGLYSDLDILCIHGFEPLCRFGAVLAPTTPFGFSNDLMMARPGHPLFGELVKGLAGARAVWQRPLVPRHWQVMLSTGSLYLTTVARQSGPMADVHHLSPARYRSGDPRQAWVLHTPGNTWAGRDTLAIAAALRCWKPLAAGAGALLLGRLWWP